jgi:molybdopterin-guanine dinucleotide biosynthesis protein A
MTGIVLIGGRSTRFGSDKVLSRFRDKNLVEHVVARITPLFSEVVLVGHRREGLEAFRVEEDILPGQGPLGGIYTALTVSTTPRCFVFGADMPNVDQGFIRYMMDAARDHDIVIPLWSKGREPLHAIYHKRILPAVKGLLDRKAHKIFDLLQAVDTLVIPEEDIRRHGDPEIIFSNINTTLDRERLSR